MSGANSSQSGLTRRSFLKTTAAVAGAAVVGGTGATTALAEDEMNLEEEKETAKIGHCSFAGCFNCDYNVVVRDGHAVKVEPLPGAPLGRRPCLRARGHIQRLYSEERIKYPMKRVGERGAGEWERISWDEAISTICEKWKGYIEQYGSQSVVFANASGMGGFSMLSRTRLGNMLQVTSLDNSNDWALYYGLHRVYGNYSPGNMTTPGNYPFEIDVFNAKTIILWGKNLSESYLQRWHYVIEAQEKGARLIAIDPNATTTTSRADRWFAPRPGSDPALMLSMVQVIIAEGLHDEEYLKTHTVGPYLVREDTGKFLRMSDLGVEPTEGEPDAAGNPTFVDEPAVWSPTRKEPCSQVDEKDPALEGSWQVGGKKVTTAFSLLAEHVQQYAPEKVRETVGLDPEEIVELARYAIEGPVTHYSGMGAQAYSNGMQVGFAWATLIAVTGMMGKPGAGVCSDVSTLSWQFDPVYTIFPTGTFANTISVLSLPEIIATSMYNGKPYPEIKSLLIDGYGFVGGVMDLNRVTDEILASIEFVVCADYAFTDSAMWSDIVLPVAMHYEVEDVTMGSVDNVAKYSERIVDAMYEAKSDYEIIQLIADGMGLGEHFPSDYHTFLEKAFSIPGYTLEELKATAPIDLAPELVVCHADGVYHTDTGRVEFYAENPASRFETGADIDNELEHLARFYPPEEAWPDTEASSKYPLQLMSERARTRWHCQGWDGSWLLEIHPEPVLRMNLDDAKARGIENGDYVEVYNDRGHAVLKASLCTGIRPGVTTYLKGWQTRQYKAGSTSAVSHLGYDPVAMSTCYFDVCVDIRKWEGDEKR